MKLKPLHNRELQHHTFEWKQLIWWCIAKYYVAGVFILRLLIVLSSETEFWMKLAKCKWIKSRMWCSWYKLSEKGKEKVTCRFAMYHNMPIYGARFNPIARIHDIALNCYKIPYQFGLFCYQSRWLINVSIILMLTSRTEAYWQSMNVLGFINNMLLTDDEDTLNLWTEMNSLYVHLQRFNNYSWKIMRDSETNTLIMNKIKKKKSRIRTLAMKNFPPLTEEPWPL